ncbi:hypothetical protein NMG60_11015429 [Bertholletia excelsa]
MLFIGGTGYLGKNIVGASTEAGHPTFALVTESTLLRKPKIVEGFKNSGVTLLHGDIYDHESMVKATKQVDVVISTVSYGQVADQVKIIAAIKEAGNIKYVASLCQIGANGTPKDKVAILGDGNTRAISNSEADLGTYTSGAVDDPRILNRILYLRPPGNTYTVNELVSCWEKKIGRVLEKTSLSEEELLKKIEDGPLGYAMELSILHSFLVSDDQTNFKIQPSFGVEASELYPDVKCTTVDEYLNQFV